jgi:stromal membrane-associated protein
LQKSEPVVTKAELAKQAAPATPAVPPPKVDYATELFNLLSIKDSGQNGSETSAADDNAWANFQCMFLDIMLVIFAIFKKKKSSSL